MESCGPRYQGVEMNDLYPRGFNCPQCDKEVWGVGWLGSAGVSALIQHGRKRSGIGGIPAPMQYQAKSRCFLTFDEFEEIKDKIFEISPRIEELYNARACPTCGEFGKEVGRCFWCPTCKRHYHLRPTSRTIDVPYYP